MRRRRYGNRDPYWTTARYAGECCRCRRAISRGDSIYYYPNGRHVYCDGADCGQEAARDFNAARQDEEFGVHYPG